MGERVFALRTATYDWLERKPRFFRFPLVLSLWLAFCAVSSWWLEGRPVVTFGNVVGGSVFALLHVFSQQNAPERDVPKPASMSELSSRAQKLARWLLAVPIAFGITVLLDRTLDGGGGPWSRPQLSVFVMFLWLVAAYLPFWQPSRWRAPEEKQLPPFPTSLRYPKADEAG